MDEREVPVQPTSRQIKSTACTPINKSLIYTHAYSQKYASFLGPYADNDLSLGTRPGQTVDSILWLCVCVFVCVRVCAHILIRDGLTLGLRAGRILLIVLRWYWFPCGKHYRKVPRLHKRTDTNMHTLYPLCPTGTQAARLDPCSHSDSLSHTYTNKHTLILYKHLTQTCRGHTLEARQAPQTESDYDLPASSCRTTARWWSDLFTSGQTDLHEGYREI